MTDDEPINWFSMSVEEIEKLTGMKATLVKIEATPKCPTCGAPMVNRFGKWMRSIQCTCDPVILTKRKIKRAYLNGEIGLSDAIPMLVLELGMMRGEAFAYLGL